MINRDSLPDIMTTIGLVVAALFVAFGIYILSSDKMANVPKEFRTIFGVVVIGYGVFRSVIMYQKMKQRRDPDEDS